MFQYLSVDSGADILVTDITTIESQSKQEVVEHK